MDFTKLIIGFFLFLFSILYLVYLVKADFRKKEKHDSLSLSAQIRIYVGLILLLISGIILVYRELE